MMQANVQQADPMLLVDWSTEFNDFKVQLLEHVVNVMYSGASQNVSY
jgi:hypothetical protein